MDSKHSESASYILARDGAAFGLCLSTSGTNLTAANVTSASVEAPEFDSQISFVRISKKTKLTQ